MNTRSTYPALKRVLDVAFSAAGLLALSPVLAVIAAAVKISSPGPILFRQERLGRRARPFDLIKFRTMAQGRAGLQITAAGDSRITRIGRTLRRYKLDELPQLINVLKGDMSLVGPRPEVRKYVERFPAAYERILSIRPGITDFAAIEFRDEESILAQSPDPERTYLETVLPAKIALYEKYMNDMSLRTDLMLTWRTLSILVR